MNNRLNRHIFIGLLSIVLLQEIDAIAQAPTPNSMAITVYTPNHTSVNAWIVPEEDEWDTGMIKLINNDKRRNYPNAELIGDTSQRYNCHGYAWHVSEGGIPVVIFTPEDDKYWDPQDRSYYETRMDQATKVSYAGDHSGITIPQPDWVISKWGTGPLMKHKRDHCPPIYTPTEVTYYAPTTPSVQPFASLYGGSGSEQARSVQQTYDGGLIVAGNTTSFGASGNDIWLLKLGRNGDIPFDNFSTHTAGGWQKRYANSGDDYVYAVQQAYDYDYIVAGNMNWAAETIEETAYLGRPECVEKR